MPQEALAPLSVYRYPSWFVNGDLAGDAAVGYAPTYQTRELSESLSVSDAGERFHTYRRLRLRDEQAFVAQAGSVLEPVAERVQLEALLEPVAVQTLAFAERGMMGIALVGRAGAAEVPSGDVALGVRPPEWIGNPPRVSLGTVVVGIARSTFREELGWQEAEENGLRQLAAAAMSELRGLQRSTTEAQEGVVTSRVEAVLESVVVLARWRDGSTCFVLMRAVAIPVGLKP